MFSDAHSFNSHQTGKQVRFKTTYTAENLNRTPANKPRQSVAITLRKGDTGIIYRVNGGTIFIGFGEDLKRPPRVSDVTRFAANISLTIHDIEKIEIES